MIKKTILILVVTIGLLLGCNDGAGCVELTDESPRPSPEHDGEATPLDQDFHQEFDGDQAPEGADGVDEDAARQAMEAVDFEELEMLERLGFDHLADSFVQTFDDLNAMILRSDLVRPVGESYPWHREKERFVAELREVFEDEELRREAQAFLETEAGEEFARASHLVGSRADIRVMTMKLQPYLDGMSPERRQAYLGELDELAEQAVMATQEPLTEASMMARGLEQFDDALRAGGLDDYLSEDYRREREQIVTGIGDEFARAKMYFEAPESVDISDEFLAPSGHRFVIKFALISDDRYRQEIIEFIESEGGRSLWEASRSVVEGAAKRAAEQRVEHLSQLAERAGAHDDGWAGAARSMREEQEAFPCRADDPGCFAEAVGQCRESTHLGVPQFGASVFSYDVVEATDEGCRVDVEIRAHNDPNLVGMTMSCELPTTEQAQASFGAIKQSVEQGKRLEGQCQGALAERLRDSNIQTVTGEGLGGHHHHHH